MLCNFTPKENWILLPENGTTCKLGDLVSRPRCAQWGLLLLLMKAYKGYYLDLQSAQNLGPRSRKKGFVGRCFGYLELQVTGLTKSAEHNGVLLQPAVPVCGVHVLLHFLPLGLLEHSFHDLAGYLELRHLAPVPRAVLLVSSHAWEGPHSSPTRS